MGAGQGARRRYRILALDGGGIRGVFTAVLLERLQEAFPPLLDGVSLFAGTSTGGILALGLASGLLPRALGSLYIRDGRRIFDDSFLDDVKDLGHLSGARYGQKQFRVVLEELFGERTLGDLTGRVLVSAFDLDNEDPEPSRREWKAKFFHNFPGGDSDATARVVDVALATTAAPTYFPTYEGYVDGGVVANNPSVAALAQALDRRAPREERARLGEMALLSLGSGASLRHIAGRSHDWGAAQWIKPLIRLMLDGTVGVADFQCRQILGDRYHRLGPVLPAGTVIDDDDVHRVPELVGLAREVDIAATVAWLKRRW